MGNQTISFLLSDPLLAKFSDKVHVEKKKKRGFSKSEVMRDLLDRHYLRDCQSIDASELQDAVAKGMGRKLSFDEQQFLAKVHVALKQIRE